MVDFVHTAVILLCLTCSSHSLLLSPRVLFVLQNFGVGISRGEHIFRLLLVYVETNEGNCHASPVCGSGDMPEHSDPSTMEYFLIQVGYQVYCEYQRQLLCDTDGRSIAKVWNYAISTLDAADVTEKMDGSCTVYF